MKLEELFEQRTFKSSETSVTRAIDILNKSCKDALWMLDRNTPIWRGDMDAFSKTGFRVADPTKTERTSANTQNFYTLIFDNHPEMKNWPKRSRSFIASFGDKSISRVYGDLVAVIPFDGVKIGWVGDKDIWFKNVTLFGKQGISDMNDEFDNKGFSDENWEKFKADAERYKAGFLNRIFAAYSPKKLGFKQLTSKTLSSMSGKSEVWVGGECVLIKEDIWNKMVEAKNNA